MSSERKSDKAMEAACRWFGIRGTYGGQRVTKVDSLAAAFDAFAAAENRELREALEDAEKWLRAETPTAVCLKIARALAALKHDGKEHKT